VNMRVVSYEAADPLLEWEKVGRVFRRGHSLPRARISDTFLYRGSDTLLSRAAWIDGMGAMVKTATIFPGNQAHGRETIHGAVSLFSDRDGALEAAMDFALVTKWKTAGDSLFAASMLARPDSRNILIVGAGTVARNLRRAYASAFPDAIFTVWNRTEEVARDLARAFPGTSVASDLATTVTRADIIACATMTSAPLIRGEWLRPGQHLDLVGAYRPDMREADDDALQRSRIFVDSRDTTLDCIGELKIPLASGAISVGDVIADYYDIDAGLFCRRSDDEITLFKNGGGAHLDLMTGRYILDCWMAARGDCR